VLDHGDVHLYAHEQTSVAALLRLKLAFVMDTASTELPITSALLIGTSLNVEVSMWAKCPESS